MKRFMVAVLAISVMALSASCGGGGGNIFDPDNTDPEIAINGLTDGSAYGTLEAGPDLLNISAVASDESGISNMAMRINGTLVASANDSQVDFAWDVTTYDDGQYEVEVTASDTAGNTTVSAVTVGVNNDLIFIPPLDLFPDFPIIPDFDL